MPTVTLFLLTSLLAAPGKPAKPATGATKAVAAPRAADTKPATEQAARRATLVTGRLLVQQGDKTFTPGELRAKLGGKKLGLDLRQGWDVVSAGLDEEGYFVAEATPGRWRLEYLIVGDGAEVFAEPQEVEARDGEAVCVGQLVVSVGDVESELGANSSGSLAVVDRCRELEPALRARAHATTIRAGLARRGPAGELNPGRSVVDVLSGLRVEGSWAGLKSSGETVTSWAAGFVLGLFAPLDRPRNVLLSLGVGERHAGDVRARSYAAGVGYTPFSWLELAAGPQYLSGATTGPRGLRGFASARFGLYAFGIGARGSTGTGGSEVAMTVDISPTYIIGSLL